MQTLTADEVKQAAREYHAKGKLTAQGAHPVCAYVDEEEHRCAIGAALSDDTILAVKHAKLQTRGLNALCEADVISISPDDIATIREIQIRHDSWARAVERGDKPDAITIKEKDFLSSLDPVFTHK